MLGYLLLDLLFFASPMSKSMYSPTSKLKVHPEVRRKDSNGTRYASSSSTTATSTSIPDSSSVSAVGLTGEKRGGAPTLLEAVNKNGLVLFLLVRLYIVYLASQYLCFAHLVNRLLVGKCRYGTHQSIHTNDVCFRWVGDGGFGVVCIWDVWGSLDLSRKETLAILSFFLGVLRQC